MGLLKGVLFPTVGLSVGPPPIPTVTFEGAAGLVVPTPIEGPGGSILGDTGGGGVFNDRPTPTVGGDLGP